MITELESAEEPEGPEESSAGVDVMSAEPRGPGRWPWRWVLMAVVATAAVGAITLQAIGYREVSPPDLHHYRVSDVSPCSGDNLKPLSDAFGPSSDVSSMERRTSSALDQAQCEIDAQVPIAGTHWQAWYKVTVTVELHKKTDPAPEFEARNRPNGPDLDPFAISALANVDRVTPVPHLGDKAYLLDGYGSDWYERDHVLTVLHGGAVFTLDARAQERWASPGLQQKLPTLPPLRPALIATMHRLMSAQSS